MTGAGAARRRLVIGIGNRYRGDDGVGPAVAEAVARRMPSGADVEVLAGVADPLDLLGRWDDAQLAVVVDAVRSGAPAGTVTVVELAQAEEQNEDADTATATARAREPAPGAGWSSTHGLGMIAAVRIARALGAAPLRILLVSVEGAAFERGDLLSPAVATAVEDAAARVLDELGSAGVHADAAPG